MGRFFICLLLIGCQTSEPPKDWEAILRQSVEERGLRAGLSPDRCCADHDSLFGHLSEALRLFRIYHHHGKKEQAFRELDALLEAYFRTRPCIDTEPECRRVTDLLQRMEAQLTAWAN